MTPAWIPIVAVAGLGAILAPSSPAHAQAKPKTYALSKLEANCARTYSDVSGCSRIANVVRGRYGSTVTMLQWNSGAGIVRHQRRQGK